MVGGYAVGAQEFKDNKDLNDIKDAPKRLSFKSPLDSSVTLSLHTRLSRLHCKETNDGIASRTLPVLCGPHLHGKRKVGIAGHEVPWRPR